jgi:hypothetical protein
LIDYQHRSSAQEAYDAGMAEDDLVQMAERALADAEEAYRLDPSDANQRRVMSAWSFVQRTRERAEAQHEPRPPGERDE